MWEVIDYSKCKLNEPVLLEGLPGIGNVGKVVADYILEQQKESTKIASFFSYDLPNTVFVNQKNMVNLPKIELHKASVNGKDYLFLVGDVQPSDPKSSYLFTEKVLDIAQELGCKEIVTLGGIGLSDPPITSVVYCTGNNEELINTFVAKGAKDNIYGVVGPIIGVTGLLMGLSTKRDMKAITLLAETYSHPMYLGVKEAKESLKILNKVYAMDLCFKDLDKEIEDTFKEDKELKNAKKIRDVNYIG